jgi:hypothetical protein
LEKAEAEALNTRLIFNPPIVVDYPHHSVRFTKYIYCREKLKQTPFMKLINIFISLALLASCNSPENNTEKPGTGKADSKKPSLLNCYRYATESDTIILKAIHVGKSITGILVYKFKEKDKNQGTIQGAMRGNILLADYTFMSEGIQSVRQVAFKLEGNTFTEGYGDSYDRNGKMIFKNVDSLFFSSSIKLTEVACQ